MATLVVEVVKEGTTQRVSGAAVRAAADAADLDSVSERTASLSNASPVRTNSRGIARMEVDSGIGLTVYVGYDDSPSYSVGGATAERKVQLAPLRGGEEFLLTVKVPFGKTSVFWGKACSELDGEPLPGAIIIEQEQVESLENDLGLLQSGEFSQKRDADRKAQAVADQDGIFTIPALLGRPRKYALFAKGFGVRFFVPDGNHGSRDDARRLELLPSASVHMTVLYVRDGVPPKPKVEVRATIEEMNFPDIENQLLERQSLVGGDPVWHGAIDSTGQCTIVDLPAQISLSIEISSESRQIYEIPGKTVLQPGEVREIECRIEPLVRVHGTAFDRSHKPIPDLQLWLVGKEAIDVDGTQSCLLDWSMEDEVTGQATTNDVGLFEFKNVPSGHWWLGPQPESPFEPRRDAMSVSPEAFLVEIPDGIAEFKTDVVVRNGLYIRGKVIFTNRGPVASGWIEAVCDSPVSRLIVETEQDGSFKLGPLSDGQYQLIASGFQGHCDSLEVPARAGDEGIVLRLRAAGLVEGQVVRQGTRQGCNARVVVGGAPDADGRTSVDEEDVGWFRIAALPLGTYDLIAIAEDGLFGILRGVDVGGAGATSDLMIEVAQGGTLLMSYEGKPEKCHFSVFKWGVPLAFGTIKKGVVAEQNVPAGIVEVEFSVGPRKSFKKYEVELEVGDVKKINYTPPK